jgi:hypothetical protein
MPGFITHYLCAQAVLGQVTPEAQSILVRQKNLYNIGAQGPDIFFYYLPGFLKKRTRGTGEMIHNGSIGDFILEMADNIRGSEGLFSYTAGFLTHYALDASAHPYVYAKTSSQNRTPMQNRVDHRKLETTIDVLMLKLMSGEKPARYKLWQLIHADAAQMLTAARAVSSALKTIYGKNVRPPEVYKAMRYMVQFTRVLQSGKGRRKRLMELAENAVFRTGLVSSIIHDQDIYDDADYLNIKKSDWHAPWDRHTRKNDSFVELFQSAAADGTAMVDGLYAFTQGGIPRSAFLDRIGNRSLRTGKVCTTENMEIA